MPGPFQNVTGPATPSPAELTQDVTTTPSPTYAGGSPQQQAVMDLAGAPQALGVVANPGTGAAGASPSDHVHPMPATTQLADVAGTPTDQQAMLWSQTAGKFGPANIVANPPLWLGATNGQLTLPRGHKDDSGSFTATPATQVLHLTYFRASAAQSVGHIKVGTGGTAAAAGNTLTQVALFAVNQATGAATSILAESASPGTPMTGAFAQVTFAMVAPFTLVPGTIYAVGILQVSTGATASFLGGWDNDEFLGITPILCGTSSGHATMPSTVSSVSSTAFAVGYFLTA